MAQACEVCRHFKPERAEHQRELVKLRLDVRSVALCRAHARIAANAGVRTFAALRELYGSGRRSYVARRGPELRLVEGDQRASRGRRASDLERDPA